MKSKLLPLLALLTATAASLAQTCDQYVANGRAALAAHNLTNANVAFSNAVYKCPNHQTGNVFYAVTRLLTLPGKSPIDSFLTRLNVNQTNRDPYNFHPTAGK